MLDIPSATRPDEAVEVHGVVYVERSLQSRFAAASVYIPDCRRYTADSLANPYFQGDFRQLST